MIDIARKFSTVFRRNGAESMFVSGKLVDDISIASIAAEEREIEEQIAATEPICDFCLIDEQIMDALHATEIIIQNYRDTLDNFIYSYDPVSYQNFLKRKALEQRREELKALRKLKTERISEMIRTAWLNRNTAMGRSKTGNITDPMLLSIPTPPIFGTAICSLICGGAVIAYR